MKDKFPDFLKSLNEKQRIAATYPLEHILVLAGAGCGKTTTIISRAAYLISKEIAPNRILILTFTKKAAFEIANRVDNYFEKEKLGIHSLTFHRWCLDILKSAPEIFGYKNFRLLDREEQLQIFKKARVFLEKSRLPKSSKLLDIYSFARNTRKSLSDAMKMQLPDYLAEKEKIAQIMKQYEEEKRNKNYFDYDDILDIVATAINQNEEVCKWLAQKYDCILVDEMQDTNPLQWNLLEPLSKYTKIFCVGDDAQAIYGFRGADFENIHSFQNRIPNSVIIKLEDNYRSTQEILDLSNWLLESSPIKYDKKLKAVLGKGKKPELHNFPNIFQESAWIAKDLMKCFKADNTWHNKLVLVRSAFSGRSIEVECLKNSIPYIFIGGQKLLEAAHIKDLISLLRIAANYKDELAWHRFLTLFNGIGEVTANKIISKVVECSEIAEVQNLLNYLFIKDCGIKLVYKTLVESESLSDSVDIAISFLNDLLMYKYGANEWQDRKKDFDYLKQLSQDYTSLEDFNEEFMLSPVFTSQENSSEQKDFVTISTIHSAKGSESDIVYIADVTAGKYPSARDIDSIDAIEEERRVLYVAMTRAKKRLVITRNIFSMQWGDERLFNELKYKYFLNRLPSTLVKETNHFEFESIGGTSEKQTRLTTQNIPETDKANFTPLIRFSKRNDFTENIHQNGQNVEMQKEFRTNGKVQNDNQMIAEHTQKGNSVFSEEELKIKKLYERSKTSIQPLLKLLENSSESKYTIQQNIGLGHDYFNRLTENTKPKFETLKKIADYFGISVKDCFIVIQSTGLISIGENPIIVEYLRTRKKGDLYPQKIKDAIIAEYLPNVCELKEIGEKYGINPDVMTGWLEKANAEQRK